MLQLFAFEVLMGITVRKKMYDATFVILIMVGLAVLIGDGKLNYATLALLQKCPMNFVLAKCWTLGLWWFVVAKRKYRLVKLDLARTDLPIAFYLCYRHFMSRFYFEKGNIEINGARHIWCLNVLFCWSDLVYCVTEQGSCGFFLGHAKSWLYIDFIWSLSGVKSGYKYSRWE